MTRYAVAVTVNGPSTVRDGVCSAVSFPGRWRRRRCGSFGYAPFGHTESALSSIPQTIAARIAPGDVVTDTSPRTVVGSRTTFHGLRQFESKVDASQLAFHRTRSTHRTGVGPHHDSIGVLGQVEIQVAGCFGVSEIGRPSIASPFELEVCWV